MPKLHYFNPGHESAVLMGTRNYTPPLNVQRMIRELSFLPVWYADAEDYVFTDEITSPRFLSFLPKELRPFATPVTRKGLFDLNKKGLELTAIPWGISMQSIDLFERLKKEISLELSIPAWKEEYYALTGRQTAAICLDKIRELLPETEIPVSAKFCTKISEIEKYLLLQRAPFILKTPYSSSGRGIHWLPERKLTPKDRTWIEGAFKKQGTVSIECALNKHQDFAMEFYSDGRGEVRYEGLSVFGTQEKGAYSGNVLGSQDYLNSFFRENVGEDLFLKIKEAVRSSLQSVYGNVYTGYLGVDMLTYRQPDGRLGIHPCIEINMRYTMGLVAKRISEKYLHPNAIGDMAIGYESKPGEAYECHRFMKKAYPLEIIDGKIREGYLSLCPVTKDTHYRAFILVV